jgi:hypothetical protein
LAAGRRIRLRKNSSIRGSALVLDVEIQTNPITLKSHFATVPTHAGRAAPGAAANFFIFLRGVPLPVLHEQA